ncbi:MAG: exodeoxyribonuclease V subunit alpha [Desulfobulbus sp.]|nr:exodeoxyribonuclease V subunit alpha [Desulfobulbus sp.]
MSSRPFYKQILPHRLFRPIDVQAAAIIARIDREQCDRLPFLAALTSWAAGQGHTCLPLTEVRNLLSGQDMEIPIDMDADSLTASLSASPAIGRPGEIRPLILDNNSLYLYRLFCAEKVVAGLLAQRAATISLPPGPEALPILNELFLDSAKTGEIDWQRASAVLALFRRIVVITGGAGTGKTYTAARILALLTSLARKPLRIALAAPTGKAALRLQESIRLAKTKLPQSLTEFIPDQAQTIHRLLGFQYHDSDFLHNSANPLHLDLLMLDEASMIDIPLMAATLSALPDTCQLILLGDKDQLASVEAGNFFGDICGSGVNCWSERLQDELRPFLDDKMPPVLTGKTTDLMADSLVRLQISHRFSENSGISALAQAVLEGAADTLHAIQQDIFTDLRLIYDKCGSSSAWLQEHLAPFILPLLTAHSPAVALQELADRRVLCALREGPEGVERINRLAESLGRRLGYISGGGQHYRGMPILILRNAYHIGLFNGDTGILWPDERGVLQAWFPLADGELKSFHLAQLPAWQPSYALTVHKAQGSEFANVLLIMPREDLPILSKELLYTGITRARTGLTLCCRPDLLELVSQRRLIRYSGLQARLRQFCATEKRSGHQT